ncbi:MAG: hypothetical protein AAF152_10645 [Cyanobacteria bacterium P01_A01_bin.114]
MSIEQTNQLILLILNSVLMVFLSTLLLGGAWFRQAALGQQLDSLRRTGQERLHAPGGEAQLKSWRRQRHRARRQYRLAHSGMLLLYCALLMFLISLFALAVRTLILADWLVPMALGVFVCGIAGLLTGASLVLGDVYQSNLLQESPLKSLTKVLSQVPRWHRRLFARRASVASLLPRGINAATAKPSSRSMPKPNRTRLRASSR